MDTDNPYGESRPLLLGSQERSPELGTSPRSSPPAPVQEAPLVLTTSLTVSGVQLTSIRQSNKRPEVKFIDPPNINQDEEPQNQSDKYQAAPPPVLSPDAEVKSNLVLLLRRFPIRIELERLLAIVVSIGVVLFMVISVEIGNHLQTNYAYNKPYFITYFNTCWLMLLLPLQFCIYAYQQKSAKNPVTVAGFFAAMSAATNIPLHMLCITAAPFALLWFLANVIFVFALPYTNPASSLSLEQMTTVLVFIFSVMFLREDFTLAKALTTLVIIYGAVMIAIADENSLLSINPVVGDALVLFSTLFSALYMVFYKKKLDGLTLAAVNTFLAAIGLVVTLIFWPGIVILNQVNVEHFTFPTGIGILLLFANALASLLFNWCLNWGIVLTSPLFMRVVVIFAIPVTFFTDVVIFGEPFNIVRLTGSIVIMAGFIGFLTWSDFSFTWEIRVRGSLKATCRTKLRWIKRKFQGMFQ